MNTDPRIHREQTRLALVWSQDVVTDEDRRLGMKLPMRKPVHIRFSPSITLGDIGHMLETQGLEAYSDCTGAICVRTIAEGVQHRAQVKEEREARLRHYRTEIVAHSPFEPPITRQVPIEDPDAERDSYLAELEERQ